MPDSGSRAVQWIVTSPLYQPLPLGGWSARRSASARSCRWPGRGRRRGGVAGLVGGRARHRDARLHRLGVRGGAVRQAARDARAALPDVVAGEGDVVVPSAFFVCAAVMVGVGLVDAHRDRARRAGVAEPVGLRRRRHGRRCRCAVTESVWNGCAAATPEPASVAVQLTRDVAVVPARRVRRRASAPRSRPGRCCRACRTPASSSVWPVQLLALKFGEAAAVNACAPLPAGAVVVNVQLVFAVADVCVRQ